MTNTLLQACCPPLPKILKPVYGTANLRQQYIKLLVDLPHMLSEQRGVMGSRVWGKEVLGVLKITPQRYSPHSHPVHNSVGTCCIQGMAR